MPRPQKSGATQYPISTAPWRREDTNSPTLSPSASAMNQRTAPASEAGTSRRARRTRSSIRPVGHDMPSPTNRTTRSSLASDAKNAWSQAEKHLSEISCRPLTTF